MSRGSTPLWSCILEKTSAQEASSNSDRCVKHRCLAVKHTHTSELRRCSCAGSGLTSNDVEPFKQGHSRRLQVCVKPVQNSGTLPLLVEAVLSVSIGCVSARSTKLQRPLDSYQVCKSHTQIMFKINKKIMSLCLYVGTIKRHTRDNNKNMLGLFKGLAFTPFLSTSTILFKS